VVFNPWDGVLRGRDAPAGALSEEEKYRRVLGRLAGDPD
jgi:hypothetical protein